MRPKKRRKCRGFKEAEWKAKCITSKARSNAAIRSEVSAKLLDKTGETEEEKEKERSEVQARERRSNSLK
jgi:hypothetical protein